MNAYTPHRISAPYTQERIAPASDGWVWDSRAGIEGWWEDDEPADDPNHLTLAEELAIRERDEAAYWARQRGIG